MRESDRIRVIAIGVVRNGDRLLACEFVDSIKQQQFYRPPGGGVEFGELGAEAVAREYSEEFGLATTDWRYLGTLENRFTLEGQKGHEVVLCYEGRIEDPAAYDSEIIDSIEPGDPFIARWVCPEDLKDPLYPEGLLSLLGLKS